MMRLSSHELDQSLTQGFHSANKNFRSGGTPRDFKLCFSAKALRRKCMVMKSHSKIALFSSLVAIVNTAFALHVSAGLHAMQNDFLSGSSAVFAGKGVEGVANVMGRGRIRKGLECVAGYGLDNRIRGGGGTPSGWARNLKSNDQTIITEVRSTARTMPPVEYFASGERRNGDAAVLARAPALLTRLTHNLSGRALTSALRVTFVPVGYPKSVSGEYVKFQAYSVLQDFSSNLRGILSTQKILQGIGVGRADTTALAATVQMYIRDGCSMLGGLLFTALANGKFEGDVKKWRMFADIVNDVAMTIDMIAVIFPDKFLLLICISSIFKAMCGVSAGACNAAIAQHLAVSGNVADVGAKNGAQHTIVQIVGVVSGLYLGQWAEAGVAFRVWGLFTALTAVHLWANLMALSCLRLRTLSMGRLSLLLRRLLAPNDGSGHWLQTLTPEQVAQEEQVLPMPSMLGFAKPQRPDVVLGASVSEVNDKGLVSVKDMIPVCRGRAYMCVLLRTANKSRGKVAVMLQDGYTPEDLTKAYVCATLLHEAWIKVSRVRVGEDRRDGRTMLQMHKDAIRGTEKLTPVLRKSLERSGWDINQVKIGVPKWLASW